MAIHLIPGFKPGATKRPHLRCWGFRVQGAGRKVLGGLNWRWRVDRGGELHRKQNPAHRRKLWLVILNERAGQIYLMERVKSAASEEPGKATKVQGTRFRVQGSGCKVQGFRRSYGSLRRQFFQGRYNFQPHWFKRRISCVLAIGK